VGELQDTVKGEITESFEYARYWNGYISIIRVLLLIMNIQEIRILLNTVIIILSTILCYLMARKVNKYSAILFLAGLISADYFVIGFSTHECFIFLITLIASIIILAKEKINLKVILFIVGSVTNFLDLLSAPIITYAIPLMVYFMAGKKSYSIKETLSIFITSSIAWLIGYALTWGLKWVIIDIIYQRGIILKSLQQVLYRSIGKSYGYIDILFRNIVMCNPIGILLSIIITSWAIFYNSTKKGVEKINLKAALPYILISVIPFAWYFAIRNHSYRHYYFAYRNLFVSFVALGIAFSNIIILKNKGEKNDNISYTKPNDNN